MTDEELKAAIRAAKPAFQARVEKGEVVVRGTLAYDKKGSCIRPDPGPGPLPVWEGSAVVGKL